MTEKTPTTMQWYTLRRVAKLGLIKSPLHPENMMSNYRYILRLVKSGQIEAKNQSNTTRPYFLISAQEIERYHSTVNGG